MLELTDRKQTGSGERSPGVAGNSPTFSAQSDRWYLVRTKQYKERCVQETLDSFVPETYLPIARLQVCRWGRKIESLGALFPSYLFARFNLESTFYRVQRASGVIGLVCTGEEPAEVDPGIISEIKARAVDGIVEIKKEGLRPGQSVSLMAGPLRGFEAIFDSYISGNERVAVLLASARAHVRVVLPAVQVALR